MLGNECVNNPFGNSQLEIVFKIINGRRDDGNPHPYEVSENFGDRIFMLVTF